MMKQMSKEMAVLVPQQNDKKEEKQREKIFLKSMYFLLENCVQLVYTFL